MLNNLYLVFCCY